MRFQHGELHLVILALLAEHPMHGYELMGELSRRLGRRYRASPGSVYPAIQSLETEGLLAAREEGDRRIYELTNEGRTALGNRTDRLAAVEKRFGIRFGSGVEIVLGRFSERVREAWAHIDDDAIERILDRAASEIETAAKRGGRT